MPEKQNVLVKSAKRIGRKMSRVLYLWRSHTEDKRFGGIVLDGIKETRFAELGAYSTQSSDYRCLDVIFKKFPLSAGDIFVDVGCGEGRVLTYLYRRFPGIKLTGVELDPSIAQTASARTSGCENVEIICGNILEVPDLLRTTTVYFLFNPFKREVLEQFLEAVEQHAAQPVRLLYLFDYYVRSVIDRPGWQRLCSQYVKRYGEKPGHFSVLQWTPPDLR